ncbi:MAG: hypothetical protein KC645_04030 [Gemmatimonadetes bacterium]|nr:hypothetical protein [Gemmatimonadota bacterium]
MSSPVPRPQMLTRDTPFVDLGQRPALLVVPAARVTGAVLLILGVGLLLLGAVGLARVLPRTPRPWDLVLPLAAFAVFGAWMAVTAARTLLVERTFRFDADTVTMSRRGLTGRAGWTEPYSGFEGIALRRVLLPARYGVGRPVQQVELVHRDGRRTVRLLTADPDTIAGERVRAYADACARQLGVARLPERGTRPSGEGGGDAVRSR